LPPNKLPDGVYTMVDSMPDWFPGYKTYWATKLHYPPEAQANNVRGEVVVKAIVGIDGVLSDIHIYKGLEASCDSEALRLVRGMPAWKPGKHAGKLVPVQITLPIRFPAEKRRLLK
jgi:protein TonB